VPPRPARVAMAGAFAAHLIPSEPGWLDLALQTPLMDTGRARRELGWEPRVGAVDALLELLEGVADGADASMPPLSATSA
jgi:UDP-glucose 4-epimerase